MPPKKKTKKSTKKNPERSENDLEAKYRRSVLDVAILQDHIDLSRRYNAMQTEMTSEVQRMEKEVSQLSEKLVMCQQELSKETRAREQVEREKDSVIADLRHQLELMETDYEKILHENLDSLSSQLSAAQRGWEDESTAAHPKYEALLSEFGLNARNI
ncbi:Coiled-coil domain-containing protein 153 [Liparis tanakae]|uniref:Dynein regulatory complex protein 12 n=1 Tax=Liparis tanakae TaxID=230148 RepID=A0A4Z2HPN4_9TELE|nr:Coiled-coil domain-containing protein 153 [Liparis tanakae]